MRRLLAFPLVLGAIGGAAAAAPDPAGATHHAAHGPAAQGAPSAARDVRGHGPWLDPARIPAPIVGHSTPRVRTTWFDPLTWYDTTVSPPVPNPACTGWGHRCARNVRNPNCTAPSPTCARQPAEIPVPDPKIGAFRVPCVMSHISYDDPIVFPGQPGRSHAHTFFGATGTDAFSRQDGSDLTNSSCAGGTLFRSRMWVPTMIDTRSASPVVLELQYYQKGSYVFDIAPTVIPLPDGLRMIAGDATNTDPATSGAQYKCIGPGGKDGGWQPSLPRTVAAGNCVPGGRFFMSVVFPNCLAKNPDGTPVLDSPDHRSHARGPVRAQAAPFAWSCPATHPLAIAVVSYQLTRTLTAADDVSSWRLSSDMDPAQEAGTSGHGDYEAHVDAATEAVLTQKCIREKKDCHDFLLGDGRALY